jgi:uncharacterized protein YdhG (YjbR/CyaY superfamily)
VTNNEVDAYIAAAPQVAQPQLRQLRAMIRAEAPKATEKMSYGIPFYEYGAKPGTFASRLIYFAVRKNHIAIYPAGGQKGLDRYLTERSTLRFPLDEPLPMAKIRALIRTRLKEKDAAMATPTAAASRPSSKTRSASKAGAASSRSASR